MPDDQYIKGNSGDGVCLPKTKRGEVTFDRLLKAAEEVIGERGYHDTSISAITDRAGVAQGTFYLYFRSKRDIFRELIYYVHYEVRSYIREYIKDIDDRKEAEVEGIKAFYKYCLEHPHLYDLIREAEFVDFEIFKWHYSNFARAYVEKLKEAMDKKQIRNLEPEMLAYSLIGLTVFTGMRWPSWDKSYPGEAQLEALKEFIIKGIAPDN